MSDGRHFAAKILRIKPNSHTMVRFAREAQMLARLRHPNLIAIVDVDITEDRVAYIVMELARGTSLAELGRYYGDCAYMVPILSQIADALSAVHADGIVHREALMIDSDCLRSCGKSLQRRRQDYDKLQTV